MRSTSHEPSLDGAVVPLVSCVMRLRIDGKVKASLSLIKDPCCLRQLSGPPNMDFESKPGPCEVRAKFM